eukprot:124384-Chlamydomonas_euryale.AAC.2
MRTPAGHADPCWPCGPLSAMRIPVGHADPGRPCGPRLAMQIDVGHCWTCCLTSQLVHVGKRAYKELWPDMACS